MSTGVVIGIDPGPAESAIVGYDGVNNKIAFAKDMANEDLLNRLSSFTEPIAIEQVRGYGLKVDNGLIDTVFWSGRFFETIQTTKLMISRKDCVEHVTDNRNAGDSEVSQALTDRIGPKGTKKQPGPTFGIAKHKWAALAVAVTYWDRMNREKKLS